MLTVAQKKTIYLAVLKNYTIESKAFTPSVIYTNQTISTYPTITLNYPEEEMKDQNSVGDYLGTPGSNGQRSLAWLSINILAKDAQGLNANVIAKDIARQLSADIRKNWKSLGSGAIKYKRKSQTRDLTHVEQAAEVLDVARVQFDVFLSYDITW